MQVSNSTEQSTDYRIGASGGGTGFAPPIEKTGCLKPGEQIDMKLNASGNSWTVVFSINGKEVAACEAPRSSKGIELRGKPGSYTLEVA